MKLCTITFYHNRLQNTDASKNLAKPIFATMRKDKANTTKKCSTGGDEIKVVIDLGERKIKLASPIQS